MPVVEGEDAIERTVEKLQTLTTQIRETRDSTTLVELTTELRRTAEQLRRMAARRDAAGASP